MTEMKIVVFEDEKHNAERLTRLLEQCLPEAEIVGLIESVEEGKKWFARHGNTAADLAFMDIQLSDGNCFEIFETHNVQIPIIFTTAYDGYALQAFKVYSVDYLLKPIEQKELKRALEKFSQIHGKAQKQIDVGRMAEEFFMRESVRFLSKVNNQLIYVKAKDIAYLFVEDGIVWAKTMNDMQVPLDYSLDQMEKTLDRTLFFRINRKLIVHIDAIKKITTYYNSRLVLQLVPATDLETVVSRDRVSNFKNWLEGGNF